VHYLSFGYDESLFASWTCPGDSQAHDVLFVGGADPDRVAFMTEFMRHGPPVAVVGGYWERYPAFRSYALGIKPPEIIRALTAAAKVNLCLVRRANRDGHVMRSFEIAAAGGCMLAEDTDEHRDIFGPEGEATVYFRNAKEATECARVLLCNPSERKRLAAALHRRIVGGAHTYADRLATILGIAGGK
jgi:spore maturation protein CgeB